MIQDAPRTGAVRTSVLEIAFEEWGDPSGAAVILMHGFPDDVRAWDSVAPALAESGNRVLVPYLRGYGPTRFLDQEAPRTAQQAAIGQDLVDFMDALELDQATLAGYDWGGRACCIASILAPERIRGLVTAGGYNVQNTVTPAGPGSAIEERAYWYQWYLNTERGRLGFEQNRRELCLLLWQEWSPSWAFDLQTFERTAPSFENPDFVAVVTHSYRHRHGNAAGEPRFDVVEELLAGRPSIQVPTVILHGADDHVTHPRRSEKHQALFPAGTPRRVIPGVGHFLPREAPQVVVEAVKELLGTRPG